MKKLILILALITSTSTAFAGTFDKPKVKSKGNQLGVDFVYSFAKHRYRTDTAYISRDQFDNSAPGVGANYKYFFNLDNVMPLPPLVPTFIAPSIFYEKIGTTAKDYNEENISLNNRYGVKLDLGLDMTDSFAMYVTAGAGSLGYTIDWEESSNNKKTARQIGLVYGGGINYSPIKHLVFNIEYNIQDIDLKTPKVDTGGAGNIIEAETTLKVLKIGMAYRF
jgi:opacity protein-like surface antigen